MSWRSSRSSPVAEHRRPVLPLLWAVPVAGIVVCAGLIWAFAGLLEEVLDNGGLVRWDEAVNLWFHAHATTHGLMAVKIITQLGGPVVLCTIVVAVSIWVWRRDRADLLWAWIMANGGGAILQFLLKVSIHRTRPPQATRYLYGDSYSFPSGHTMGATVCLIGLVFVMAAARQWSRRQQILAYVGAAAVVCVIAWSRLYLGVHYPSDVIGGGIAGGAWIVGCLTWCSVIHHRNDRRATHGLPAARS